MDELSDISENIDKSSHLDKMKQQQASPIKVKAKPPNMLRIIKMNAEKHKKRDLSAILSASDPKVKDAKPKVQSFNKNYYKPLFLRQKAKPKNQSIRPTLSLKPSNSATEV